MHWYYDGILFMVFLSIFNIHTKIDQKIHTKEGEEACHLEVDARRFHVFYLKFKALIINSVAN